MMMMVSAMITADSNLHLSSRTFSALALTFDYLLNLFMAFKLGDTSVFASCVPQRTLFSFEVLHQVAGLNSKSFPS